MTNSRYYVVDRVESGTAILVSDAGDSHEIPLALLPSGTGEDSVLRVPMAPEGPAWSSALVDRAERERRIAAARKALDELGRQDAGGDITI